MQDIVLTRDVDFRKYEVLLEIGRQAKRPEIHAVLLLSQESPDGQVTPALVCQKLFPDRPESVGKAVVKRCQDLDLLDDRGYLTRAGEETLQTGFVFVPERGKYVMWYCEDPLIPEILHLLHLEPEDELTINDELAIKRKTKSSKSNASNDDSHFGNPFETPASLLSLKGKTFDLLGKGGGTVFIKEIENKCTQQPLETEDKLRVFLEIPQRSVSQLKIVGKFNKNLDRPDIEFADALLDILGPLREMWDDKKEPHSLRCKFIDLDEKELNTFQKDVFVKKPQLRKFGEFNDATLKETSIKPASLADAEDWARWILRRSINTYLSQVDYQDRINETVNKFSDFSNRIKLPDQKELAKQIRQQFEAGATLPEGYWYLQAPLDLVEPPIQS